MTASFSFPLKDAEPGRAVAFALTRGSRQVACVLVFDAQGQPHAFENLCPHWRVPLASPDQRFFTRDGRRLRCAKHGAEFDLPGGDCVAGPCEGDRLRALTLELSASTVTVRLPSMVRL